MTLLDSVPPNVRNVRNVKNEGFPKNKVQNNFLTQQNRFSIKHADKKQIWDYRGYLSHFIEYVIEMSQHKE